MPSGTEMFFHHVFNYFSHSYQSTHSNIRYEFLKVLQNRVQNIMLLKSQIVSYFDDSENEW